MATPRSVCSVGIGRGLSAWKTASLSARGPEPHPDDTRDQEQHPRGGRDEVPSPPSKLNSPPPGLLGNHPEDRISRAAGPDPEVKLGIELVIRHELTPRRLVAKQSLLECMKLIVVDRVTTVRVEQLADLLGQITIVIVIVILSIVHPSPSLPIESRTHSSRVRRIRLSELWILGIERP